MERQVLNRREYTNRAGDADENKASLRLLEFMLTNNAQEALHLRASDGNFPVNDTTLELYTQVYDDFDGCFAQMEDYTFQEE